MLKPRARLTEHDVLSIFRCKYSSATATKLAIVYGVSEKAVRDIWTGRTWARETRHLVTSGGLPEQKLGRPKGSRDAKPRKSRSQERDQSQISLDQGRLDDATNTILSSVNMADYDKSLDEQLFEWERDGAYNGNQQRWVDPFQADWNVDR